MCGIFGWIGWERSAPPELGEALSRLAHRGPDGSGDWCSGDGACFLGHRRLAILDLSDRGAQPMASPDGHRVIVFNGEIYNYLEVRSELQALGHSFSTDTDTEVILEAYSEWGEDCLERFNGMFAFALLDLGARKLFCARDRYGEKPFLYTVGDGFFAFGSEFKALLGLPGVSCDYDEFQLIRFAHRQSGGLDGEEQTIFKAICQLPPAHYLSLDMDDPVPKVRRFWDVREAPEAAGVTEAEAQERFRELMVDSVRLRMRSDVPVGSCLSGGLDSSAIVGIARHLLGENVDYHTFTGRFPGTPQDEWEHARQVVEGCRTTSHIVEPTGEKLAEELEDFLWYNELPVGSASQYAQYCVFRLAKEQGVTVLLDGQGADELLGGYEPMFKAYLESLNERRDGALIKAEEAAIRERYPMALPSAARSRRDQLPWGLRRGVARLSGRGSNFLFGIRNEWHGRLLEANQLEREPRFHALGSLLYQESFGRFLSTLLRYGDRNSMAHSREVRLPFCDHRLPEFVFSLPPEYLMGGAQTKRLLRGALAPFLPEGIRTRWNKQGFLPPQADWLMRGPLADRAADVIHSRGFRESPFWLRSWWEGRVAKARKGDSVAAVSLWQPLMLEEWKSAFARKFLT